MKTPQENLRILIKAMRDNIHSAKITFKVPGKDVFKVEADADKIPGLDGFLASLGEPVTNKNK